MFSLGWVERALNELRPYGEVIAAWIASGCQDESRLLRGNALVEAQQWAADKSLSNLDYRFLTASQDLVNRETQEANLVLTEANRKARRRIQFGSAVLIFAFFAAGDNNTTSA